MQRMFPKLVQREIPIETMIEHMQEVLKNNEVLAEKAKKLYATVLAVNEQHEQHKASEYKVETVGLRNRKHPELNKKTANPQFETFSPDEVAPAKKDSYQAPSLVGQLSQTMLGAALGPVGVVLLNATAAAALPAGLVVESGAAGGKDLCAGLVWCIQQALKNATDNKILAQFSRTFGLTGQGGSFLTEVALGKCFDEAKLTEVIGQVLDSVPNGITNASTSSTAQSSIWAATQTMGSATHLTPEAGVQFENFFEAAATSCQNWHTSGTAAGIGLGISLGAVCLVVCCAVGCLYACDKDSFKLDI